MKKQSKNEITLEKWQEKYMNVVIAMTLKYFTFVHLRRRNIRKTVFFPVLANNEFS